MGDQKIYDPLRVVGKDLDRASVAGDGNAYVCHMHKGLGKGEQLAFARLFAASADLLSACRAYLVAQRRMRDQWADADEALRAELWRDLHACEDAAAGAVLKATERI